MVMQSLAASRDAGCVQSKLVDFIRNLAQGAATSFPLTHFSGFQFPQFVSIEEVSIRDRIYSKDVTIEKQNKRLVDRLRTSFDIEPLEDGICHPAEEIIRNALRGENRGRVHSKLREVATDGEHPTFAASILRCLGRQTNLATARWRTSVVREALAVNDVEMRDAAVQAAELWEDRHLVDILKSHEEPEPWLREYIRGVVEDLSE